MSQNKLYSYYIEQLELFQHHFNETLKQTGVEDIHQLRVATKKIRALLTLMEIASCGEFSKRKHFKLFSKLFKNAGVLREIQVNCSSLDAFLDASDLQRHCNDEPCQRALSFYREYLEKQDERAIRHLTKTLPLFEFNKIEKLNVSLKKSSKRIDDSKIVKESKVFIDDQIESVHTLCNRLHSDRELHKIRAHLKSMAEIYRLNDRIVPNEALKKKVGSLKNLEKRIGQWHDNMVLISSIEQFFHNEQDASFTEPLKRIVGAIRDQNGELREEVVDRLAASIMVLG